MAMAFFFFDALPSEESAVRLGAIKKDKKGNKSNTHVTRDEATSNNGVANVYKPLG